MASTPSQKDRLRCEGTPRPADLALLVRDAGPMVIRNERGRRVLQRRRDGLCPMFPDCRPLR